MSLVETVLFLLLALLGGIGLSLKSYFQKKGENLATKEDIQGITKEVETIKNQLHYSMQAKLSLKDEERNAIVGYFEKYHVWVAGILNASFSVSDNKQRLDSLLARLDEAQFGYVLARGRASLFVKNTELDNVNAELNMKTSEMQNLVTILILKLKRKLIEMEQIEVSENPINVKLTLHQNLLNEIIELNKVFHGERLAKYQEMLPFQVKFIDIVHGHLQGLIENEKV